MTPVADDSRQPAEKPTVYRGAAALIGGGLVTLFCGFGSIDLMVESGTRDLVGSAVLMLVAVLAWLYGVYPAAFAWTNRLVVRNPFRTIELPWHVVEELNARLSFVAHTQAARYTVWAIPVSLRERRRSERHRLRELSQVQRAAKRGVPMDAFQTARSYRPADPADGLSFADQAIAEMNARREAHTLKARLLAKQAAESDNTAGDASLLAQTASVRWAWLSLVLLGGSVAFLIVALIVR